MSCDKVALRVGDRVISRVIIGKFVFGEVYEKLHNEYSFIDLLGFRCGY